MESRRNLFLFGQREILVQMKDLMPPEYFVYFKAANPHSWDERSADPEKNQFRWFSQNKKEENSMKKILAMLLAMVMVIGLVACGGGSAPAPATTAPKADAPVDTPTEPAEDDAADEGGTVSDLPRNESGCAFHPLRRECGHGAHAPPSSAFPSRPESLAAEECSSARRG